MNGNLILAVADLGRSVASYSERSKTLAGNYYLFLVVGFLTLFWIGLLLKDKIIKLIIPKQPRSATLFSDLCEYHRLNRADKKWLKELGEVNKTEQPAMVFVRPEWFLDNAKMPVGSGGNGKRLLKKLFGKDFLDVESTV